MKNIEWRYLRALNELYTKGTTRIKLTNNDYINKVYIEQRKIIRPKPGNHLVYEKRLRFDSVYENEISDTFLTYNEFFLKADLENDAKKTFTEDDLKSLIFIYNNKEELRKKLTTEHTFSNNVFKKSSKYMSNKTSLKKAVLKLLEITEFPDKDPKNNQWRFVVDCEAPCCIVLCENLDCLRVPDEYKKNNVELWYVGGRNTKPLLDLSPDKLGLPIYYFCDWDYDGLSIYSAVKEIIKAKGADVVILEPKSMEHALPVDIEHHNSDWKHKPFSNLKSEDFSQRQITLITELINRDLWIEEQSMDLLALLNTT